ncbi:MAG: TonB-dependent receptor, partial [Oleibacter sp.]|nr:TonB-dependent receptor [Thalassolituus sp.]
DTVKSDVYFGGTRINNNYRVFGNAEWRIFSPLVMNLGGTYEREDINDDVFSPRVAFTYLLTQQQSLRLVYAEAIRSPDLLEQRPNYIGKATNIQTDNYLNLENGRYFAHQTERRHLDHERIQSWEIGYYGSYLQQRLMLDIKLYRDHLSQLIANATGIRDFNPSSDLEMNIDGVDAQVHWRPNVVHEFWWSGAYVNNRVNIGNVRNYSADQIDSLSQIETRLSAEYSNNVNWIMRHNNLSLSQSYFWHNAYNGNRGKGRVYRRYEMSINKNWPISYGELSTGIFWHHIVNNEQFIYEDEQIASNDIVLFKLGMQF